LGVESEGKAKQAHPRNFEQVLIAFIVTFVSLPAAYAVSHWIVVANRPDYDFDGSGGANYTGTTTRLLQTWLFPVLLLLASIALWALENRRWLVPIVLAPLFALLPYPGGLVTLWLLGIPMAEYRARQPLGVQLRRGLAPVLTIAAMVPILGFLNHRY
jgi:hypothetical protein